MVRSLSFLFAALTVLGAPRAVSQVDEFMKPPTVTFAPDRTWPDSISTSHDTVKVWCYVEVDTLGNPLHVRIMKSNEKAFNRYALKLAKLYHFTPGESPPGQKIPVPVSISLFFYRPLRNMK